MSAPLRVVHLISGDLWAGAEAATFHLVRALRESEGVDARAVVLNEGELARRLRAAGVPVAVASEEGSSLRALAAAVRRHVADADLVHAHRSKEDWLAARSRRPWVCTRHGRPEPFRGRAALRAAAVGAVDRVTVRRGARLAIAVSAEVERWLGRWLPRERVVRIHNGIRDPLAGRAPRPWAQRPRRVGVAARLVPVKGIDRAIEAVARCPDLELEVVGDGPERERLETCARRSNAAGRIRFLGFREDVLARMETWRALLVTSGHEGNPLSVLEALASGTPVVAGPLGGVEEILEGRGGWILPDRDPERLAVHLSRSLADPEAGARVAAQGRARFDAAFRDDRCARATAAAYAAVQRSMGKRPSVGGPPPKASG